MRNILILLALLIAFLVMASLEGQSAKEEIRRQVMNLDQDVYEYILLQIEKDDVTDEDIWEYYNTHRKTCEEIEIKHL